MAADAPDVLPALAEQRRHQIRAASRRGIWIGLVGLLGFGLAALGLVASITLMNLGGRPSTAKLVLFVVGFVLFGSGLGARVLWPFYARCRIVPYFAREMGRYPGPTSVAFTRGRGLHRQSAALDRLAGTLGVTPLSAFGFDDDLFGQSVRWSPAADGLRTVEALRAGLGAEPPGRGVAEDLDALAAVLRIAAEQGVDFALVLRVGGGDLQSAAIFEPAARIGRFW